MFCMRSVVICSNAVGAGSVTTASRNMHRSTPGTHQSFPGSILPHGAAASLKQIRVCHQPTSHRHRSISCLPRRLSARPPRRRQLQLCNSRRPGSDTNVPVCLRSAPLADWDSRYRRPRRREARWTARQTPPCRPVPRGRVLGEMMAVIAPLKQREVSIAGPRRKSLACSTRCDNC